MPTLIVSAPVLKGIGVSLPIYSWMDINAYNVPSKYIRNLLPMLSIVVVEPLVIYLQTIKLLHPNAVYN
jgi:hypothetical protein